MILDTVTETLVLIRHGREAYYQQKLRNSLGKELPKFKNALENGGDINLRYPDKGYTVFELACKTSECSKYIEACQNHAPKLTEIHPVEKKSPIHFAALSYDKDNIEALLSIDRYCRINIDQFCEDRTALYLLCEALSHARIDEKKVFECIDRLLEKGANINATCVNGIPALWHLLVGTGGCIEQKWKILEHTNYNLNLWNGKLKEAIEKKFPGDLEKFKQRHYENETVLVKLKDILINGEEQTFIEKFEEIRKMEHNNNEQRKKLNTEEMQQLMMSAVHKEKLASIEHLLRTYSLIDDEAMQPDLFYDVLDLCYKAENEKLFELISKKQPVNHAALSRILKTQSTLFVHQSSFLSFDKLVEQFIDSIDQPDELTMRTALFYAVSRRNEPAQMQLLAKGAYLCTRDFEERTPICDIDLGLLKTHLDSCVKANEFNVDDENFQLSIDLSNFSPKEYDETNMNEGELYPLVQLAERLPNNSILEHPVIASIITMKRSDLYHFRILYFAYHLAHFIGLVALMIKLDNKRSATFINILISVIVYLIVRLIFCCIIDFKTSKGHIGYKDFSQLTAKCIQSCLILFLFAKVSLEDSEVMHRVTSAFALLLLGIEATFVLVKFPWLCCSSNIIMIVTVLRSYCKSLLPFAPLLTVFAVIFHILFKSNQVNEADDQLSPFQTCRAAILKTIVMTTGEFDTSSIKAEESWAKYLFFLIFLLFVYNTFSNFICGLAVDDTTKLRAVADVITFQQETALMHRLENIKFLFSRLYSWCCMNPPRQSYGPAKICVVLPSNHPESFQRFDTSTDTEGKPKQIIDNTILRRGIEIVKPKITNIVEKSITNALE